MAATHFYSLMTDIVCMKKTRASWISRALFSQNSIYSFEVSSLIISARILIVQRHHLRFQRLHFESKFIQFSAQNNMNWIRYLSGLVFISCALHFYYPNLDLILTIFLIPPPILALYTSYIRNKKQREVDLNCRRLNVILSQCSGDWKSGNVQRRTISRENCSRNDRKHFN